MVLQIRISVTDHVFGGDNTLDCVYGENSNTGHSVAMTNHNGGNVGIRYKVNETRYCGLTDTPTSISSFLTTGEPSNTPTQAVYNDSGCKDVDGGVGQWYCRN